MKFRLAIATMLLSAATGYSQTDLGVNGLLGNDLTDLGNDGVEGSYAPPALGGFDAEFFGDDEPGFEGAENSFNVFDNAVGGGSAKWCCNSADVGDGVHVGADFRNTLLANPGDLILLTHFTITSDNDVGINRDPDVWAIQGSLDGSMWTDIFAYNNPGNSPFDDFGGAVDLRTLQY
ncbi:MAG: hypothetical protein N2C14_26800, partial [Planctomycetales bacterium]